MRVVIFFVIAGFCLSLPCPARAQQTGTPATAETPAASATPPAVEKAGAKSVESSDETSELFEPREPAPYQSLRYDEDYSYLAEKRNRTGRFDRLKYIPLRRGRENWYFSVGGEARMYYERVGDPDWGNAATDGNGYLLQRYLLHTDWHFGNSARFFFQIGSSVVNDRRGGARPVIDKNDLDVRQAFFDYRIFAAGKNKKSFGLKNLTIRLGRQEMAFGAQRMISVREGANVRRSFDGARLTANFEQWRVDGFAVKETQSRSGFFDDRPTPQTTFWGVYATRPIHLPFSQNFLADKKISLDVYYLGLDVKRAVYAAGAGPDIRHSFGARAWSKRGRGFDFDYEAVVQTGSFRGAAVRAWGAGTETGFTFEKALFRPRVGVRLDVASGDRNRGDNRLNSFNQLYPEGYFFGRLGAVGFVNLYDVHPLAAFHLTRRITVTAESLFFFRQSLKDTVYSLGGFPVRATGTNSRARYTGNQLNFSAEYRLDRHTTVTAYYSRFNAGDFFKENPPGKDTDYAAVFLTYKF